MRVVLRLFYDMVHNFKRHMACGKAREVDGWMDFKLPFYLAP